MSRPGSVPLKNHRHERYCVGLAEGRSRTEAYLAAGYIGSPHGGTNAIDNRPGVADRTRELQRRSAEMAIKSQAIASTVTRNLLSNRYDTVFDSAMEGTPVLAKDGSETGVMRPDLAAANASIAGQAKLHGLSLDVSANVENLDEELEGKTPEELKTFILGLLESVDPNLRKTVEAQLRASAPDDADESIPDKNLVPETLLQ